MYIYQLAIGVIQANWCYDKVRKTILTPKDFFWAKRIKRFEESNKELVGYVFH